MTVKEFEKLLDDFEEASSEMHYSYGGDYDEDRLRTARAAVVGAFIAASTLPVAEVTK